AGDGPVGASAAAAGGAAWAVVPAKQAQPPGVAPPPAGQRVIDDLLVHVQEALARVSEGVEPARLDERFDRALVEGLRGDALAEVEEIGERPAVRAGGDEGLDEPLADVVHGRHTASAL